ncbi:AraC family transcriptional regulator [Bifidobacterium lemurum]|uniref:AraC family transcriptional regulator n=1 Tax=Bifidobacterium lemurum TaxID=1603886 RepID=A0A261FSR7_9BIFI|nr:AraC family transcriptional regulator [Bifidobacterium lemurum]
MSGPGWRHMRRTMDDFELIIVRRGVLPIRVGESDLLIREGEMALVPAGVEHVGTEAITASLEFVWMHFRFAGAADGGGGTWTTASRPSSDDRCVSLPLYGAVDDAGRLAVMSNQLLDLFAEADSRPNAYCSYCATALLLEITMQMRRRCANADGDGPGAAGGSRGGGAIAAAEGMGVAEARERRARGSLRSVHSWIRANAFDDISVADVAARFHYSPSYLTSLYHQAFGIGIVEQIVEYRVDRARELLSTTSSPVAAIAAEVGYEDAKYFMRVFKRRTGLTPTQYRAAFPARLYNTV